MHNAHETNSFIQQFSEKKHSLVTGNGTSALYLALKSSKIQTGAKIIVSNISCPDVVYAVIWAGYKPYFVDVNYHDYNISIPALQSALESDKSIKGIIAVHLFGGACDVESISNLAKKYNLFFIEDCAQSLGNKLGERYLGGYGDVSIFSFGNGKIIEAGHGGSIQSNDQELIKRATELNETLPAYNLSTSSKYAKYHRKLYYKLYNLRKLSSRLNFLNRIFVLVFKNYYIHQLDASYIPTINNELKKFETLKEQRLNRIEFYLKELKALKGIQLPSYADKGYQLSRLTIVVDNPEEVSQQIRDAGIPSNTMYPILMNRFTLFFKSKSFPNSIKLNDQLLNLWTNNISEDQQRHTIDILKKFLL